MADYVRWRLMIAWDMTNYVDESARLVEATGESRFAPAEEAMTGGRGIVDSMSLTLSNHDNRFSPLYTASPIFAYIQNGKCYHAPVYLEISVNGGVDYERVFTGVIKIPQIAGPTANEIGLVSIECRSRDEFLLQRRLSTTQADFRAAAGLDESQVIGAWLAQAGISSGDMVLSPGLYSIAFPWLDDESPLEEIWSLAGACGGRFYCDRTGKYVYENATTWLTAYRSTASQETLTQASYEQITPSYTDGDLYNVVTVESSARYIAAPDTLWEPDEEIVVPAGASKLVVARLRQAAWTIDNLSFVAVTAGGTNITSSVSISAANYAQRVEMTISNSHATQSAHLRPLKIIGRAVTGGPSHEESRNSTDHGTNASFFASRGSRTKSIRAGVYVQSQIQAGAMAEFLLRRYEIPRLNYQLRGVVGSPFRQLGDRVTIDDEQIGDGARDAILIAIRWSLDNAGGYTHDLELMDAGQLFPYHPTPGYFVIGTDVLDGTAKLFF